MIAVAAISKNNVLGKDGKLAWPPQKEDMLFFKQLTWNKNILVGRKTFFTLPLLKNRKVYVFTRSNEDGATNKNGCEGIYLDSIYINAKFKNNHKDRFNELKSDLIICGGAQLYYKYLPKCLELYLTEFDFEVEVEEDGEIVRFPYSKLDLGAFFNRREEIKKIKDGTIWKYSK